MAGGLVGGQAGGGGDGDVRGAELGVVEEEGGLGGGVLLEGHGGGLGLAFCLDVEAVDLAAMGGRKVSILVRGANEERSRGEAYQKLKKSRISLSSVLAEMFLTSTVVADIL